MTHPQGSPLPISTGFTLPGMTVGSQVWVNGRERTAVAGDSGLAVVGVGSGTYQVRVG